MRLVIAAAALLAGAALTANAQTMGAAPKSEGVAGATGPGAAPMTMPNAAASITPSGDEKSPTAPSSADAVVNQSPKVTPR